MKKLLKVIIIVGSIIISIVLVIFAYIRFGGYTAISDVDAIREISGNGIEECETIIYKYETDEAELIIYSGQSGQNFEAVLYKRGIRENTKYKIKSCSTSGLTVFWDEWYKINRHLQYTILENEEDIKNYDCGKYKPIITQINFEFLTGEKATRYVCVIDEKGDGVVTVGKAE